MSAKPNNSNICKTENLQEAASKANLNVEQWKNDHENNAEVEFNKDLQLARQLGVRGFPTLLFVKGNQIKEILYGSKPYHDLEKRLLKIDPQLPKSKYSKNWKDLFAVYPTLTTQEFAVLSGISFENAMEFLLALNLENKIGRQEIKNGDLWILEDLQPLKQN